MRQLIALVCLLLGACASTGRITEQSEESATTWRTVAVASVGADLATTLIGQDSGAREQNPMLGQQPQRIVAVNLAILGAVWWLSRDLPPHQQATVWKWFAAFHLGAAVWNVGQVRR